MWKPYSSERLVNTKESPNKAWWGPILEKAAAKFYVDYSNMDGGSTAESLYMLTGAPIMDYDVTKLSSS